MEKEPTTDRPDGNVPTDDLVKDQKSAGELRPAGDSVPDQYRYVVMPMRI